jgi:ATP-dependent DNA helicase DinG
MNDYQNEISRTPPQGAKTPDFTDGEPILYAYNCALLECDCGDCFIYTAVNLDTEKSATISKRKTPLAPKDIERTVERIRSSGIAGAARLEADRPYGARIAYEKCREILCAVFEDILPQYGYTIREEQLALAGEILENIRDRKAFLAEAEVGIGKTIAYIVAAVLAKRGRLNDFWNKSLYPQMAYVDMAQMPIVIATASIALQEAIVKDYIPEISRVLLEHGIIREPLTAALRKGREHFLCDRYLRSHFRNEHDGRMKAILEDLITNSAEIDLAEINGLTPHVKRQISVPDRCSNRCPRRASCRYLRFVREARNPAIDIQVTNHNYLIADALHRSSGKRPLLPNYQIAVIDEGHKFLSAARSMYGTEFSSDAAPSMHKFLKSVRFSAKTAGQAIAKFAKKLCSESNRLFRGFAENLPADAEDDPERYCAEIDREAARHLRNIRDIADRLHEWLESEQVDDKHLYKKHQLLWEINQIRERASVFVFHKEHVCWLEQPAEGVFTLCSIPKDLDKRLYSDFWSKGIPATLASATLSASGDFSHIKRVLGLDEIENRIAETSKPSPFNYRANAMLYISEATPFPDGKNGGYVASIANEIENLARASRGHSIALFTSYDTLGRIYAALSERGFPFPLMRLERGSTAVIERFKQTRGAVLFATGAIWEGINIPGDALSMLIIVKLPFQAPDPIGEYEQTLYRDTAEYKKRVLVPEMLIKLKQGFGRLIRTETDTGVVAILDCRANSKGAYRERVLEVLPDCCVTDSIDEVGEFFRAKKPSEYFDNDTNDTFSALGKRPGKGGGI